MQTVTVIHRNLQGSDYRSVWTKTEWFCPNCGSRSVYEDDHDDYYVGNEYLCVTCGASFNMPSLSHALRKDHELDFETIRKECT